MVVRLSSMGGMKLIRIVHPNDSNVFVEAEVLDRRAQLEVLEIFQQSQDVVPLAIAGTVLRDKKGKAETAIIQKYKAADIVKLLKRIVKGWGGFKADMNGQVVDVPYAENKVDLLFDEGLDVRCEGGEELATGKCLGGEHVTGFYELIIAKATDADDPLTGRTFGKRPTEGSETQAIGAATA